MKTTKKVTIDARQQTVDEYTMPSPATTMYKSSKPSAMCPSRVSSLQVEAYQLPDTNENKELKNEIHALDKENAEQQSKDEKDPHMELLLQSERDVDVADITFQQDPPKMRETVLVKSSIVNLPTGSNKPDDSALRSHDVTNTNNSEIMTVQGLGEHKYRSI